MSGDDYLFEIPVVRKGKVEYVANPYSPELRIALGVIWECHNDEVAAGMEEEAEGLRSLAWLILYDLHDPTGRRPDHIHSAECERSEDCPIFAAGMERGRQEDGHFWRRDLP